MYKLPRDLRHPKVSKEETYEQLCELLKLQYNLEVSVWREPKKLYDLK